MKYIASFLLLLAGAAASYGADTYNPANKHLSIPSIAIGSATYFNVVVTVGGIVSGPVGATPNGNEDSYDPEHNLLTVQSVNLGAATYHNVVITVAGLDSIGSVSGADSYGAGGLAISLVQVGGTVYDNVLISVGSIVSIAGGMPTFVPDTYSSVTNRLAIPAVQVGNTVYTNAVITVGHLLSVGGIFSNVAELVGHAFSGQNGTQGVSGSTDGAGPEGGLIQGQFPDTNFYGTTYYGGVYDQGSVFKITPAGTETVLYSFSGNGGVSGSNDGAHPKSSLILGSDGNLYGTTLQGGANGNHGTIFKIALPAGTESVLYSFCAVSGCPDGYSPYAGLIQGKAPDTNFYGTTLSGGLNSGVGTVFKISPSGAYSLLYSFRDNGMDGSQVEAPVVEGSDGNFYGTTFAGGAYGSGSIFKVTPAGTETVLYSFCAGGGLCADGASPDAALLEGTDGNFYGVTPNGGAYPSGNSGGVLFRITPAGDMTVLHSFCGYLIYAPCVDGANPAGELILGRDGNFYGATRQGGVNGTGAVFKFTPTAVETMIYSFDRDAGDNPNGLDPISGLTQGSDGNFYGVTNPGGIYAEGTVYRLANVIPVP